MDADNWLNREEPAFIKGLNQEIANAVAYIAPWIALNYLASAVYCLKPIHIKHIKNVRKEDIRD